METIFLIPRLCVLILMFLSLILLIILLSQLIAGLYNVIKNSQQKIMTNEHPIFNFYIFHHLLICIIRCLTTFLICFYLIIYRKCLTFELFFHFLFLLSTFDLFFIIIGETAHFWDTTINYKSTLYSKYCLIFGIFFNYFLSTLFLSIHITIGGDSPLTINLCKIISENIVLNEPARIPLRIIFILFFLLNLLICIWIYISYKDISKLKQKRLATVFFYSLLLTKHKENERTKMVNQSLKRLLSIYLFFLSNIIVILPTLIIKIFNLTLNIYFRSIFIYFTILPWCESITFLFFPEMKYNFFQKKIPMKINHYLQQRIGRRLSSYQENNPINSNI